MPPHSGNSSPCAPEEHPPTTILFHWKDRLRLGGVSTPVYHPNFRGQLPGHIPSGHCRCSTSFLGLGLGSLSSAPGDVPFFLLSSAVCLSFSSFFFFKIDPSSKLSSNFIPYIQLVSKFCRILLSKYLLDLFCPLHYQLYSFKSLSFG